MGVRELAPQACNQSSLESWGHQRRKRRVLVKRRAVCVLGQAGTSARWPCPDRPDLLEATPVSSGFVEHARACRSGDRPRGNEMGEGHAQRSLQTAYHVIHSIVPIASGKAISIGVPGIEPRFVDADAMILTDGPGEGPV